MSLSLFSLLLAVSWWLAPVRPQPQPQPQPQQIGRNEPFQYTAASCQTLIPTSVDGARVPQNGAAFPQSPGGFSQSGSGFPQSGSGFPQSGGDGGGFPQSGSGFPQNGGGFPQNGGGFPQSGGGFPQSGGGGGGVGFPQNDGGFAQNVGRFPPNGAAGGFQLAAIRFQEDDADFPPASSHGFQTATSAFQPPANAFQFGANNNNNNNNGFPAAGGGAAFRPGGNAGDVLMTSVTPYRITLKENRYKQGQILEGQ